MKLKIFSEPDDYNDYLFWRSEHHKYAVYVIVMSLLSLAVSKILF